MRASVCLLAFAAAMQSMPLTHRITYSQFYFTLMHNIVQILEAMINYDTLNTHLHTQGCMFCKLPEKCYQRSCILQRNCILLLLLAPCKLWGEGSSKFSRVSGDKRGCHESIKRTSFIINAGRR